MNLTDLIHRTRLYCRDNNSYVFTDTEIKLFINEGIDLLRQYNAFRQMKYLNNNSDEPIILPDYYHYILALYASSRCFDKDERFYEGTEKRNEFETKFNDLVSDVESGNIKLTYIDENEEVIEVENDYCPIDYITDEYYGVVEDEQTVLEESVSEQA